MGRKSKRKANLSPDEVSKADRKELIKLCAQVIELAATPTPPTPDEQWEEFLEIHTLLQKIRKRQNVAEEKTTHTDRETYFEPFLKWLQENGVTTDSVKIAKFDEGYGLKATKDIKIDEELMSIPRKVMMTDQNAIQSPTIGDLVRGDRLLKRMPNVSLAVFILSEKFRSNSFWQPYIDILPSSYNLPLYYTPDEIKLFQGSSMFSECLKQHKNIARQYAYLFKQLNSPENSKLQLRDHFTYDLYRWAVSTVMTRQNQIPSKDGKSLSLSLIPLWDMCNHANGEMKTDFIEEKDSCVNMAMRDFNVGDQIFICYGRRSSADLLLYSGFISPDNSYDSMTIQLGLSSGDRLYAMKAQLCAVMKLPVGPSSQSYHISASKEPVSLELLTFLRIFCMSESELRERLLGENRAQALFNLVDRSQIISKLNELRTCVYLATRVTLLQRQYKTNIQEDEEKLKAENLSDPERAAIQLLMIEKRTLENLLEHCAFWRERIEALPEDATSFESKPECDEDVVEKWEDREEVVESDGGSGVKDGVIENSANATEDAVQARDVVQDTEDANDGERVLAKDDKEKVKSNGVELKIDDTHLENGNANEDSSLNGRDPVVETSSNGSIKSSSTGLKQTSDTSIKVTPNGSSLINGSLNSKHEVSNLVAHNQAEILSKKSSVKKVNGAINGHSTVDSNGLKEE